ncbi:hypothetical protein COF04_06125 [Bacillus toyonensis]|nr:hypothetical protein CON80_19605 [Bacillus toyonensis]PFY25990.1 hypothetical protein COL44_12270 [Bacillus toyonensis]PHC04948.1 hypothetical protein COF04_06125 [Bacillus toyonensis]PHE31900.1 hypothetical protein COF73_09755 [Bacillus toyonensis]
MCSRCDSQNESEINECAGVKTGSRTLTSKFGKCREVRREINYPIGSTNNQWTNPPLIKVSLYKDYHNDDNFCPLAAPSLFLHL